MIFTIQDTFSTYRKIIAESDIEKKREIFREELVGPFEGMFRAFGATTRPQPGGNDALVLLKSWSFLMPEMLDEGAIDSIQTFERAGALKLCEQTMNDVLQRFTNRAVDGPQHIQVGIFLQDSSKMDSSDRGYTGFGGIPGYIMLNYGEVTDFNLARLRAALAHEAHHNIYGFGRVWDPAGITVGKYIIMEGLAESFAASLYGEELVGPWITDFNMADMPRVKAIIKNGLNIKGFDAVRQYVFGDAKTWWKTSPAKLCRLCRRLSHSPGIHGKNG